MIKWRNDKLNRLNADELLELVDVAVASDIDEPENAPLRETFINQIHNFYQRDGVIVIRGFYRGSLVASGFIIPSKTSGVFKLNPGRIKELEKSINTSIDRVYVPAYIYLHPKLRGKGYGKRLADYTNEVAKSNGFEYLSLYGYHNTVSHSFYTHGYELIKTGVEGASSIDREDLLNILYAKL